VNQFNLKRKKIPLCNIYFSSCFFFLINLFFILNSVKGIVERIEDNNDDSKKRSSERASVQAKLPSDRVRIIFLFIIKEFYFNK